MLAEGTYAYEFDLPFEEVDDHGELVEPEFTHDTTPGGNAEVVGEFTALF